MVRWQNAGVPRACHIRLPLVAVAALTCAALAACGGTRKAGGTPRPRATTAPATTPPTRAQAAAIGQAVNLRSGDLPGFRASPHRETARDRRDSARLAACAGAVSSSRTVAASNSPDFTSGAGLQTEMVNSSVSVLPSAALAARDLAVTKQPKAENCLKRYLNSLLASQSNGRLTFGQLSLTQFSPAGATSSQTLGYRLTVTATVGGSTQVLRRGAAPNRLVANLSVPTATITLYLDLLDFLSGPVETTLDVMAIGHPFSPTVEQRLYGTLVARTRQATARVR